MRYGLNIPLRERDIQELRHLKREAELSIIHVYSRTGTKQAERWLKQIEEELGRRNAR
jgi:hypothetical protein